MKHFASMALALVAALPASAENRTHLLDSDGLSLVVTTNDDGPAYFQYFGPKLAAGDLGGLLGARSNATCPTLPAFGMGRNGNVALAVRMPDGTVSTDLRMTAMERSTDSRGELITLTFEDPAYPALLVRQYMRRYAGTEVFALSNEFVNRGKKGDIELLNYASACVPVTADDNRLTHFTGGWAAEAQMHSEPLGAGVTTLKSTQIRNAWESLPGFMLSTGGDATENSGNVFAGNLSWGAGHKTTLRPAGSYVEVISGINEEQAPILLKPGENFVTPEFLMTFSSEGKGGASRNFHRWGRRYGMAHGDTVNPVLLNSWEGVYFNVSQEGMTRMMADWKDLGGELFVMDDGWFGTEFPRNDGSAGLGDWQVNTAKLPRGIRGLTDAADSIGVSFGIWIEPEMANTRSELFTRHPDWVLSQPNRRLLTGRGGTQVVLDLCNPKVQDFVFGVVDSVMTNNPEVAYIKWDCNADIMNYASPYLGRERQSETELRFNRGLENVLRRVRAKYPDVAIQLCSSGGGRVCYGLLPWFDEFWPSDDTDALQRVFIQWGTSHFYPAQAQASHVSASPNHQTGRSLPLKFRFDVAMSGRLGMEMQPSAMNDGEREFARRAIAAYKNVRPVIQLGDQYRLVSPYDGKHVASLMYATESKDRAVVFAYRTDYLYGQQLPALKLDGVDPERTYRITDLTPLNSDRPCHYNGLEVSGRVLRQSGLDLNGVIDRPDASVALLLEAM